jgi:PTS system nitrogen regulatory IIA component
MEILDILHPQDVLVRVPVQAKRPLLEVLARRLASRSGMSAVSVLSALLGREKLGATSIGQGIGMPHAMLDGLQEPAAVLAVLEAPIPYHAPDDQSVDVVLAVIWPRNGSSDFLTALARFCRRLSDPQVLRQLRGSASAEEALRHLRDPADAACPSIAGLSALAAPRSRAAARGSWR